MKIEKLTDANSPYFETICEWSCNWWGRKRKPESVKEFMLNCLNEDSIPMTYIAIKDDKVVGMYQLTMDDDLGVRPNYYPWLVNVYVDEACRGQRIGEALIKDVEKRCRELNIKRLYLHSKHVGLYEKYGWVFLEEVETFNVGKKRVFYLDIE